MKDLLIRAATGTVFVAVLVSAIIVHPYALAGLFYVIAMLGLWEFYGLVEKSGAKPQKVLGMIMGSVLYGVVIIQLLNASLHAPEYSYLKYLLFLFPLFVIITIAELYRKGDKPFDNLAYTFFGVLYVVLPFTLFNFFVTWDGIDYGFQLGLTFFIMIWANDTFAYLSGRAFGKHKLFERISPKKTWEGTIGGVLATMGVGVVATWLISGGLQDQEMLINMMAIGAIIAVTGGLGDLVESMFKRSIDVKDSGKLMPGHGGILDRFDGVLLAAPAVFFYLMMVH